MLKFQRFVLMAITALSIGPLTSTAAIYCHPYHVSMAEVHWNEDSGNFEVALCVWPGDLELAIREQKQFTGELANVAALDSELKRYVEGRFLIHKSPSESDGDKNVGLIQTTDKIRWVGQELELRQAWLYFEIPGDKAVREWTIENRIFNEFNLDQLNQIQLSVGDDIVSVRLQPDQPNFRFSTMKNTSMKNTSTTVTKQK